MEQIINNALTDKNAGHTYLPVYESLFKNIKDSVKNILEIGVYTGGSMLLWNDYFLNATVHGLDVRPEPDIIKNIDRIKFYNADAYNFDFIRTTFEETNMKFDILIDDGPHSLDSMMIFASKYSPLLTDKGILVIEDIQDMSWIPKIIQSFPKEYQEYVYVKDRRHIIDRYDDVMIILDKRQI